MSGILIERRPAVQAVREYRPLPSALILGLGLSLLTSVIMPGADDIARLAFWPLGMALGLLTVGFYYLRRHNADLWGMVLSGQVLGVVAIGLMFIASVN